MIARLRRYVFVARIAARQTWSYRGELWMRAISMVLFMGIFIALWHTVYGINNQQELAGYSLAEMIWYLGLAETITLSTSRVFMDISEEVKAGNLTYTLTRPMSYPFFQMANSLGNSLPRFCMNLITAVVVVMWGTRQIPILGGTGSWAGALSFLLMASLGLILDALIAVLIGLLAFWLEEVMPVFFIYQKLIFILGGLFLPLEVFPLWLAKIARVLPFQFIVYAPAHSFVSFDLQLTLQAIAGQVAYITLLALLVMGVWKLAQRRLVLHGG